MKKSKNDPNYTLKKKTPEFKAKLRESCKKYYNKVENNKQLKRKVSAQKKEYYIRK